MSRFRNSIAGWCVCGLIGLVVVAVSADRSFAEDGDPSPKAQGAAEAPAKPVLAETDFKGNGRCARCHQAPPTPISPDDTRDFCLMNESKIFLEQDKHSRAYEVLTKELGQQMGQRLGYKVTEAKQCLTCHVGPPYEIAVTPRATASGLNCEACHGPSGRWDGPHSDPEWRTKLPGDKKKLGMEELRNPAVRAEVCFSCHIGNARENKVVTHAMYAAGHPPLPPIEVETFTAAMPRHWRNLNEKGNFQFRKQYTAVNPGLDGEFPRTKSLLIGRVVALRESLQLIAAQSRDQQNWPELAMYDCQGCHHELREPAWRQKRLHLGMPGRPRPAEWPAALVRIGSPSILANVPDWRQQLDEKLGQIKHIFDEQPFGNPQKLGAAVEGEVGAAAWFDGHVKALLSTRLDEAALHRELHALYALDSEASLDFQTARQVAWAIRVIEIELRIKAKLPKFLDRPDSETADARPLREEKDRATLVEWKKTILASAETEVVEFMNPLNTYLSLVLPAGIQPTSGKFLGTVLQQTGSYDPEEFRKLLHDASKHSGLKSGDQAKLPSSAPRR
jgi:hypothetical protein